MLQLIHPFLGDSVMDGVGLAGCLFVLILMWEAWKERRIRIRRGKRARDRAKLR